MKRIFTLCILILSFISAKATHNRAGEITYKQLSVYGFEFTVTTFTYSLSIVEQLGGRDTLRVDWGDNSTSLAPRISRIPLPDFYLKNTYIVRHTFPGPGVYEIVMQDPNRNLGVINIPNSVNVIFAVKTTMIVNPQIGPDNSPVLLNDPIDKAALNKKFIHNPAAYDPDGDSLSYKLAICLRDGGKAIENYTFPRSSVTPVYVDSISGNMIWDSPMDTGIFNIAMNVEEWRRGVKIGNIVRDMQVEVHNSNNRPPQLTNLKKICIEAGKLLMDTITATDPDYDPIKLTASGGPFVVPDSIAKFNFISGGHGFTSSLFSWQTTYNQVRKQPYNVVVKAEDFNPTLKLVDIKNFQILVLAPAPRNLIALPTNNIIRLKWSRSVCSIANGYDIYRASTPTIIAIDSCNGGIDPSSGYEKIGHQIGLLDTTFQDNNGGTGLSVGINYCYRVVATFADGAQSYPSTEACAILQPGFPALTSASVTKISSTNGEVLVSWIKPTIDTIAGPFVYVISRSLPGGSLSLHDSIVTAIIADTTYIDKNINTQIFPYDYKVELYSNAPGNRFLMGNAETASTMYPQLIASDNQVTVKFARNVPWINDTFVIYKQNLTTSVFDSIGITTSEEYLDKGLANGQNYTYKVKAYGTRTLKGKTYRTLNWSHVNSATAIDTIAPCAPKLNIKLNCTTGEDTLRWSNPNHSCSNDAVKYKVYFKANLNDNLSLIATVDNINDTTYIYKPEFTAAGCFAVSAIDSFNNESKLTNLSCIENTCPGYQLPNVFTPNGDNINDLYVAYNPNHYVKLVNMKIFSRWGNLVFQTSDPDINWDGRDMKTKQPVPTGVYYYLCDVYEPRLSGITIINLPGFINVFTDNIKKPLE